MRTAPKLREERELEHVDWLFAEHVLVWRGTLGNHRRKAMLAAIERELGDATEDGVHALTAEGDVHELLRCDGTTLDKAVLEWLRCTLSSDGFGGYPSYAQWVSVLQNARAEGREPHSAPEGLYPIELLRLAWSYAQLCLFTNARLRREKRLSRDSVWPQYQAADARDVLSSDRDDLAQRFARWSASASTFLKSQGIDVPASQTRHRSPVKGDALTGSALGENIEAASTLVALTNRKYLEQPDSGVSDRELPNVVAEPLLDHVLIGQQYIVSSHSTPKALLRPMTRAPSGASSVLRKQFEADLATHLNEVQAGKTLIVRSAKESGPAPRHAARADAVIAQPPPKRLVDERRAQAEEQRKESGRARMRKVREHRRLTETEQQAEIDAKLQAIDGLSLEEVKEAVRLLKKGR